MDSEAPETGAPISVNAPQRPLRIGRGDKYYEVLYVGGVAQERRLGRRANQDEARNSLILDDRQQQQEEKHPVLDAQDPTVSEFNPQPSVRRRRSRQGLAVQPTPPLRRHRPGSIRSKESTPSRESSEASYSEELVRDNSTQSSLYVLPEQDSEVYSNHELPTIASTEKCTGAAVSIYDRPRHLYSNQEEYLFRSTVNCGASIKDDDVGLEQLPRRENPLSSSAIAGAPLYSSDAHHANEQRREGEFRSRVAESQRQLQDALQNPQQVESQRQQPHDTHGLQQGDLQDQQLLEPRKQQETEVLAQQRAESQRQQLAELKKQEAAKLRKQREAESQKRQQAELQQQLQQEFLRQHQQELQRQQEAELARQQQAELQSQQLVESQKQERAERGRQEDLSEFRVPQEIVSLRQQQSGLQEHFQAEPIGAQGPDQSHLLRKPSQKNDPPSEEHREKTILMTPEADSTFQKGGDASPREERLAADDTPRGGRKESPRSVRSFLPEPEKTTDTISVHAGQFQEVCQYGKSTSQEDDGGANPEIRAVVGNAAVDVKSISYVQHNAAAPTKAPVAHREMPNEPTLGTTSPESLVDWYENDESFLGGGDDDEDDQYEGSVKRKPSKIIRKIKGLFENKKSDENPSSTSTERKRSDQLEPPRSPREPTTPTKKSKLGQFFSFSKKDERKKASPPPPLMYAPAVQGPEEIPDGMLAKVFRSKLTQEKVRQPTTPKTAPPFPNFREWSPSTEDLSNLGSEKEFTKPSKYFVPKIPPFQRQSQTPQDVGGESSMTDPGVDLKDELLAPEAPEARNSPYSLCRNRGSVKGSTPRRTSLVEDDVNELYEQFFRGGYTGLLPNPQKPPEDTPGHTFVRKPSKKAAAIPPELRAPIYQPPKDETPLGPRPTVDDSDARKTQPTPTMQDPPLPESPGPQYIEVEEILIEEEILEEPNTSRETRDGIRELRPLFKQAWMLIDFMTQDLIDGVPKEAWGELRIFFLIMIGMLVLLYAQGILRFTGNNPLCFLKTIFKGFQILLGSAIQAGMTVHDAVDAMLTDASSKLVADTLNEI